MEFKLIPTNHSEIMLRGAIISCAQRWIKHGDENDLYRSLELHDKLTEMVKQQTSGGTQ